MQKVGKNLQLFLVILLVSILGTLTFAASTVAAGLFQSAPLMQFVLGAITLASGYFLAVLRNLPGPYGQMASQVGQVAIPQLKEQAEVALLKQVAKTAVMNAQVRRTNQNKDVPTDEQVATNPKYMTGYQALEIAVNHIVESGFDRTQAETYANEAYLTYINPILPQPPTPPTFY